MLESASRHYQIGVSVRFYESNILKNVITVEDRFVIAEFSGGEILFSGSTEMYNF